VGEETRGQSSLHRKNPKSGRSFRGRAHIFHPARPHARFSPYIAAADPHSAGARSLPASMFETASGPPHASGTTRRARSAALTSTTTSLRIPKTHSGRYHVEIHQAKIFPRGCERLGWQDCPLIAAMRVDHRGASGFDRGCGKTRLQARWLEFAEGSAGLPALKSFLLIVRRLR
jgi:hypothetical protein